MHNVHRGGHFERTTKMTIYLPFGSGHSLKVIRTIGEWTKSHGGEKFEGSHEYFQHNENAYFHNSVWDHEWTLWPHFDETSLRVRASFQHYWSSHVSLMSLARNLNTSFNERRQYVQSWSSSYTATKTMILVARSHALKRQVYPRTYIAKRKCKASSWCYRCRLSRSGNRKMDKEFCC